MNTTVSIAEALSSLLPNGYWSLVGDAVAYHNGVAYEPTSTELATEVTRLQAAYDAQEYARSRKAAYDLLNQDEMRYDDLINSTTTWQDAIAAIKLEYPQ